MVIKVVHKMYFPLLKGNEVIGHLTNEVISTTIYDAKKNEAFMK